MKEKSEIFVPENCISEPLPSSDDIDSEQFIEFILNQINLQVTRFSDNLDEYWETCGGWYNNIGISNSKYIKSINEAFKCL